MKSTNIITFGELKKLINEVPKERDDELVSVYDLKDGERFHVTNLDTLVEGTLDINFNSDEYTKED